MTKSHESRWFQSKSDPVFTFFTFYQSTTLPAKPLMSSIPDPKWELLIKGYAKCCQLSHLYVDIIHIIFHFTASTPFDPTLSILLIGRGLTKDRLCVATQNVSISQKKKIKEIIIDHKQGFVPIKSLAVNQSLPQSLTNNQDSKYIVNSRNLSGFSSKITFVRPSFLNV